jgi:hypothetical protein
MTTTDASVRNLTDGSTETTIGTFYCGGSFPRTRYLYRNRAGAMTVVSYNPAGSFHSSTNEIQRWIDQADSLPTDDGVCGDSHAFAAALRDAIRRLAPDEAATP